MPWRIHHPDKQNGPSSASLYQQKRSRDSAVSCRNEAERIESIMEEAHGVVNMQHFPNFALKMSKISKNTQFIGPKPLFFQC